MFIYLPSVNEFSIGLPFDYERVHNRQDEYWKKEEESCCYSDVIHPIVELAFSEISSAILIITARREKKDVIHLVVELANSKICQYCKEEKEYKVIVI